jgi:hypothetical protein
MSNSAYPETGTDSGKISQYNGIYKQNWCKTEVLKSNVKNIFHISYTTWITQNLCNMYWTSNMHTTRQTMCYISLSHTPRK